MDLITGTTADIICLVSVIGGRAILYTVTKHCTGIQNIHLSSGIKLSTDVKYKQGLLWDSTRGESVPVQKENEPTYTTIQSTSGEGANFSLVKSEERKAKPNIEQFEDKARLTGN